MEKLQRKNDTGRNIPLKRELASSNAAKKREQPRKRGKEKREVKKSPPRPGKGAAKKHDLSHGGIGPSNRARDAGKKAFNNWEPWGEKRKMAKTSGGEEKSRERKVPKRVRTAILKAGPQFPHRGGGQLSSDWIKKLMMR